jgi:HD-like signal output (HDOD) protein
MASHSHDELVEIFRSADALPPLPDSATRVITLIDNDDSSTRQIQSAVSSDPALTANLIRAASTAAYLSLGGPVTSVEAAVQRLGLSSVRLLIMGYALQSLMHKRTASEFFEPSSFALHSTFSGVALQWWVGNDPDHPARRVWSLSEVFVGGLLHDLPICLLAHVTPEFFDQIWHEAGRHGRSFAQAFQVVTGAPINELAVAVGTAWNLSESSVQCMVAASGVHGQPFLVETLRQIEWLSEEAGFGLEPGRRALPESPDLIPAELHEDVPKLVRLLRGECERFLGKKIAA